MTTRVALVVTGRLEFRGLPRALGRLFPDVEFHIARSLSEGDLRDSTSRRVDPGKNRASEVPTVVDDLVTHLAGNVSGKDAADLSFWIEDLELVNRGNEDNVLAAAREAAMRHTERVAARGRGPIDLAGRLRERASFHLLDPMVEAYFFEDPGALVVARGGTLGPVHRVEGRDPERFLLDRSAEIGYFGDVGECSRHRRPKDRRCPWAGEPREEHPKKYLKYLCREAPPHEFCSTYQETVGGVNALAGLDFGRVLSRPGSAPFLRAFVEDLADALGTPPLIPDWPAAPTSTAPTALWRAPRDRVLRNV